MQVILRPIRVPWSISPSMSGVTLIHSESDESPECTVITCADRLSDAGRFETCRVDIEFDSGYFARIGPHDDSETIEAIGYKVTGEFDGDLEGYDDWRVRAWRASGTCPDSGFYVAANSEWIDALPAYFRREFYHYVIDGRDGYVELIARKFAWKVWAWDWPNVGRDDVPSMGPVIDCGCGIA